MTPWMRWRIALAWHRHQLRHWQWAAEVALCRNDPAGVGAALAGYDRADRRIHLLQLAGP